MNCPKCNHTLPDNAKFCLGCGAKVPLNCSSCQTPLPAGAKFCLSCGQPVAGSQAAPASGIPDILGYCTGSGSAIRASDPHFKCLRCKQLFVEKFRFQDHPVCESCAYEGGEAIKRPHICPVTGMEFVIVPEGEFQMGDVWGDGDDDAKPTHLVTVPAFQMAKYPVTQAQWLKVMGGENPAVP